MALDDYIDPEMTAAVAATAAVLSPPVRRLLHQGAVLGMTGVLMVGDGIFALGRGVGRGYRGVVRADGDGAAERAPRPRSVRRSRSPGRRKGGEE